MSEPGIEKIVLSKQEAEIIMVAKIMAVINLHKDKFNTKNVYDQFFKKELEEIQKEIMNIIL